jgi:hypothetical protein
MSGLPPRDTPNHEPDDHRGDADSHDPSVVPPLFEAADREPPPRHRPSVESSSREGPLVGEPLPPPHRPPFEETPLEPIGHELPIQEALPVEPVGPPEFFTTPLQETGTDWWRSVVRWGAVLLLAFFSILLVLAWSAIQTTGEETGRRIIQRSLLPITEIDDVLDAEYNALVSEARLNQDPATIVFVPSYPLEIPIPTQDLATMSREELRTFLLIESTARMYDQGVSIFQRESTGFSGGVLLSARGVLRLTVGQITQDSHQIAQIVGGLLLFVTAVMVLAVVLLSDGFQRIRNVGFALSIGMIPMTMAVVAVRFAFRTSADDAMDPFNEALFDISVDLMWIPIRNFIIFSVLGLLVLGLGIVLELWQDRVDRTNWHQRQEDERRGSAF